MTTKTSDCAERPQFKVEFAEASVTVKMRGFRFPASAWEERSLSLDDARALRDALTAALRKADR